ncbi:cytochrome C oxidase subunit II [Gracilibacillus alcaliphilus]|uniref:cytochrome C oxidase subunit II n=1 Tax=Gracilibacillus alcaliphilus TaxID=1401441 RepID=UPI001957C377|nr:cytochrome C oxidase subunit II [Gracilibacillus alcaliphilus]MBM7675570.1 heme/copper-type cytochrome/quinol oxidase subunit 2 [Gracilibacillus alcaliphilus]
MQKIWLGITTLSLALMLAACGGDDTENNTSPETETNENGEAVNITASNWEFDQEEYTASAGEVVVNLSNEDGYHGIEIDGTDIAIDGDGSATATLEAGEYTIRCSIPCGTGHNDMVATLVVQ